MIDVLISTYLKVTKVTLFLFTIYLSLSKVSIVISYDQNEIHNLMSIVCCRYKLLIISCEHVCDIKFSRNTYSNLKNITYYSYETRPSGGTSIIFNKSALQTLFF